MTEFNVGDNVTVTATGAETEIAYGPYRLFNGADLYFTTDSEPRTADQLSAAPADPRREIAVNAIHNSVDIYREDAEAAADAVLTALDAHAEQESAAIKVGDRVRVLYAKFAEDTHGKTGTVVSTTDDFRENRGDLHPYTVEMDDGGDVSARDVEKVADSTPGTRYRDRDGDVWEVQPNGSPQFVRFAGSTSDIEGGDYCAHVSELNDMYGPLTRL